MHNTEERIHLERTIIGACLLEKGFDQVKDILSHADFTSPNNLIYTAFVRLNEADDPIDLITVYHVLEKNKQPVKPYYLAECTTFVNSWSNLPYHSLILLQHKLEDDMIKICRKYSGGNTIDAQLASNCFQKITEYTDPLKTMDLISAYLYKRSPESPFTKEIITLNQKFDEKCQKIRQNLKK